MSERQHQHLDDDQLAEAWVLAFRILAEDFSHPEGRKAVDALIAEYSARGSRPPYHLVADEMTLIRHQMNRPSSEEGAAPMQRVQEGLEEDLQAFATEWNRIRANE